jgi:hypothetical protein
MIRIAISEAAFEALPSTPLPVVAHEQAINNLGPRYAWLSRDVLDRLEALRRPGEDYSDVIMRLAEASTPRPHQGALNAD